MIRVLHIFHNMGNGGVEHFVMNYYRHLDRSEIQFDFLTSVDEPGYFDEEIMKMGGRLYRAYPLQKNPLKNYFDIGRIVKENGYDIVHRHTGSAFGYFDLLAAKRGGAKNLILHSHNPQAGRGFIHKISKKLLSFDCIRLACSQEAGEFLFGKDASFTVINNAIDCKKYVYDPAKRCQVRAELGIHDELVIGHIGRFETQKNHKVLLRILKGIKSQKRDCCLICIGDGSLMSEVKSYAVELGLKDSVMFLGARADVNRLINAFDVFCFPSLYEGFSITLIEAQANGLKCFVSKDVIPEKSNIAGNVAFIPLAAPASEWADRIISADLTRDKKACEKIQCAGYDIFKEAEFLQDFYKSLI